MRGIWWIGLVIFSSSASAQFIRVGSCNGPDFRNPYAPLIADIVAKSTAITPWGKYTETTRGKFWRARGGNYRQDDSYGNSFLFIYPNDVWVDHQLRNARISVASGVRSRSEMSGTCRTAQQRGTLAGREVIGSSPGFLWDVEWGVNVLFDSKRPTLELVQQLINAEEKDPDPELFTIPDGYKVITCIPSKKAPFPADCPEELPVLIPDSRR